MPGAVRNTLSALWAEVIDINSPAKPTMALLRAIAAVRGTWQPTFT